MNSDGYQLNPLRCEIIFFLETSGAEKIPMNTTYSVDELQTHLIKYKWFTEYIIIII